MRKRSSAVLVRARPGGLVLDLETGGLFSLNASATSVWESWLSGSDATAIARRLADTYGLSLAATQKQVDDTLALKGAPAAPPTPLGEYRYQRSSAGYVFSRDDVPLLSLDKSTGGLRLADPFPAGCGTPLSVLMAIAPKLLAFRGHFVLHASAALLDGRLVAIGGASGAGKTTTVRALVRAGATLVSEDKLVVRLTDAGAVGLIEGEPRVHAWARTIAEQLAAGRPAGCDALDRTLEGPWIPLREIGFIDSARRAGDTIGASDLAPVDGAHAIFRNAFYGSDRQDDWERHLRIAAGLADAVPTIELHMPLGVGALDAAVPALVRAGSLRSR
jgi:hypothetical protein